MTDKYLTVADLNDSHIGAEIEVEARQGIAERMVLDGMTATRSNVRRLRPRGALLGPQYASYLPVRVITPAPIVHPDEPLGDLAIIEVSLNGGGRYAIRQEWDHGLSGYPWTLLESDGHGAMGATYEQLCAEADAPIVVHYAGIGAEPGDKPIKLHDATYPGTLTVTNVDHTIARQLFFGEDPRIGRTIDADARPEGEEAAALRDYLLRDRDGDPWRYAVRCGTAAWRWYHEDGSPALTSSEAPRFAPLTIERKLTVEELSEQYAEGDVITVDAWPEGDRAKALRYFELRDDDGDTWRWDPREGCDESAIWNWGRPGRPQPFISCGPYTITRKLPEHERHVN